jgi:hypothetical protein
MPLDDLTGKEALLLARALTRLADDIWRTYEADIVLVLDQEHRYLQDSPEPQLALDDADLPF